MKEPKLFSPTYQSPNTSLPIKTSPTTDSDMSDDIVLGYPTNEEVCEASQEDSTILVQDLPIANAEMIQHYIEVAQNGGMIILKSVEGRNSEVTL